MLLGARCVTDGVLQILQDLPKPPQEHLFKGVAVGYEMHHYWNTMAAHSNKLPVFGRGLAQAHSQTSSRVTTGSYQKRV